MDLYRSAQASRLRSPSIAASFGEARRSAFGATAARSAIGSRSAAGLSVLVLLLLVAPSAGAQTGVDPTGHWEATVPLQGTALQIEIDLMRDAGGQLAGTYAQPAQKLRGLPLSKIVVEGRTVSFTLPVTGSTFQGTLDDTGGTLAGQVNSNTLGTVALTLTRNGPARIEAAPKSAALGKELEGTWKGMLDVDGGLHLILTMINRPDGTSTGRLISVDQAGLELPAAMVQNGSRLTIDFRTIGSSFAGVLNAAGTEIAGTFTTAQGAELPLTFQRDGASGQRPH